MPVAGGPKITKTGILLEVDAANGSSYASGSSTWINVFNQGTNNGTINGTVGFDPDDSKGALTFPGTASTFVDFGNIGNLSSVWSFQVAVKPAPSASGNYTILSYASGSDTGSITYKLDYSSSNQSAVLSAYSATGSTQIVYTITGSVPTGSWSIINASYGNSLLALNVNGIPSAFSLTTGSTVGYNANNRLYLGGTFGVTSSFYTGSLASFFAYNSDVPGVQLIQNYNAFATRFGRPPSIFNAIITDPDAYNFIETALIIDTNQQLAINNLVTGLKTNNLWDKMQAIYPFVGGTAYSHKFNLKDLRDTDAAFRIQFFGAVTHNNLGVSASVAGYGDTRFFPSTNFANVTSSLHASIYMSAGTTNGGIFTDYQAQSNYQVRTLDISPNKLGEESSPTGRADITAYSNFGYTSITSASPEATTTGLDRTGLWAVTRTSPTLATAYRRSPVQNFTINNTNMFTGLGVNNSMRLFRGYQLNGTTTGGLFTFASLGEGLTTSEIDTLYTLLTSFNNTLGRS